MIVLEGECWYVQLKNILRDPLEPSAKIIHSFNNSCPKYSNNIKEIMMPVKRSGMAYFQAEIFISNPTGLITPNKLIEQLYDFPDVGKCVYNRPRKNKAATMKCVNVTVLRLITSGLI